MKGMNKIVKEIIFLIVIRFRKSKPLTKVKSSYNEIFYLLHSLNHGIFLALIQDLDQMRKLVLLVE